MLGAFIHNYTLSIFLMLLIFYLQYARKVPLLFIPSCLMLSCRMNIIIVIHVERLIMSRCGWSIH